MARTTTNNTYITTSNNSKEARYGSELHFQLL